MTATYLKTLFGKIAEEYGFKKHRYMCIKDCGDFLLRISFQSPQGNDEYRFNAYFLIKAINKESSIESFLTFDITGDDKLITSDGEKEFINPSSLSEEELSEIIGNSIKAILDELENDGIEGYLRKRPDTVAKMPTRAKEYAKKEGWI